MSFDPKSVDLPIVEILDEVKSQLQSENTLIVHAPPGAGEPRLQGPTKPLARGARQGGPGGGVGGAAAGDGHGTPLRCMLSAI